MTSNTKNLGCAHVFEKLPWGVLIGAGVLNKANMVGQIQNKDKAKSL